MNESGKYAIIVALQKTMFGGYYMKQEYIECGKFVGTHGVKGALRVQPWCDTPEFLCGFKTLYKKENGVFAAFKVNSAKPHGNIVIMEVENVCSIDDAEHLRNKTLYLARKDLKLEKGAYLICDLLGCTVFDYESNKILGQICDVSKTGANDVWHIKNNDKEYLVPVIDDVIKEVDIDKEKVVIKPLAGIFDDAEVIKNAD